MTQYTRLLYEAATKLLVDKRTATTVLGPKYSMEHVVQEAKANGHIKETVYIIKQRKLRKQKRVKAIKITREGLAYLRSQKAQIGWVSYLPNDFSPLSLQNQKAKKQDIVTNILRITTAAIVAEEIVDDEIVLDFKPADRPTADIEQHDPEESSSVALDFDDEFYDEEDIIASDEDTDNGEAMKLSEAGVQQPRNIGKEPLCKIVTRAIDAYHQADKKHLLGEAAINKRSVIRYIDGVSLKRSFQSSANQRQINYDIHRGRISGLYITRTNAYPVYVSQEHKPLSWDSRTLESEQALLSLYTTSNTMNAAPLDQNEAILLVAGLECFEKTYRYKENREALEKAGKIGKLTGLKDCGDGYDHLYVFPVSLEGVNELKEFLETDHTVQRSYIEEQIKATSKYHSSSFLPLIFPLEDLHHIQFAICTTIDVRLMQRIERTIKQYPENKYGILCRRWQIAYVKKILPGIEIRSIDDEMNEI